jgi:hypothetical protein
MTFDEALEILEMSSRENPAAARRAYLLQLQRNGPEVPPDLYARFTAAYEILKAPSAWSGPSPGEDSLEELKREAEARRARPRAGSGASSDARVIDPSRVPQRNQSQAETRIIDPTRVPQRMGQDASSEAQAPRIRRHQRDPRQAAGTHITREAPEPSRGSPVPPDRVDPSAAGHAPGNEPDPFEWSSQRPEARDARLDESPTVADFDAPGAWVGGGGPGVETSRPTTPPAPATAADPFADLLSADAPPEQQRAEVDLSLGGEMDVHPDPTVLTEDVETPQESSVDPFNPDMGAPLNRDPLAAVSPLPNGGRTQPRPSEAPVRGRGRSGSKSKPKPVDDAALASFSKIARTFGGVIEFPEIVQALEKSPDDAIGAMALDLLASGERVAATSLIAVGFECMEGKPTRRWIEVRGCLELVLKLTESASEDHTSYECALSIIRSLNRWRAETEDPRIVFLEATRQRWSWLNEMTLLPQKFPNEIRSELVHAIRAGDLEEAVLPLSTYASRHEDEMAKLKPELAAKAPKMWGALEPMLRAKPKKKAAAQAKDETASEASKSGDRRRRRKKGQRSSSSLPGWAWGLIFVLVVCAVFVVVAQKAVQQETEADNLQVAADGICKVSGGNKPACIEARRVVRSLRESDCDALSAGLIQDFAKAIEGAQQLRGALDTGGSDDNLTRHEGVLIDTFYAVCQAGGE